jgi:hypothetical protein
MSEIFDPSLSIEFFNKLYLGSGSICLVESIDETQPGSGSPQKRNEEKSKFEVRKKQRKLTLD